MPTIHSLSSPAPPFPPHRRPLHGSPRWGAAAPGAGAAGPFFVMGLHHRGLLPACAPHLAVSFVVGWSIGWLVHWMSLRPDGGSQSTKSGLDAVVEPYRCRCRDRVRGAPARGPLPRHRPYYGGGEAPNKKWTPPPMTRNPGRYFVSINEQRVGALGWASVLQQGPMRGCGGGVSVLIDCECFVLLV